MYLRGPQELPTLCLHVSNIAVASYTSSMTLNDIVVHLSLYVKSMSDTLQEASGTQ